MNRREFLCRIAGAAVGTATVGALPLVAPETPIRGQHFEALIWDDMQDDCNHQRLVEALRALGTSLTRLHVPPNPYVVWLPNNVYDEAAKRAMLLGPEGMYRPRREMPVMPENRGE